MFKRFFSFIIFFLCFTEFYSANSQCVNSPIVYNTNTQVAKLKLSNSVERFEPEIKYIGEDKDSIFIGSKSMNSNFLISHLITPELNKKYPSLEKVSANISIEVCNKNIIKLSSQDNFIDLRDNSKIYETNYYLPIIVRNLDSIPIYLSSHGVWPYKIEVQSESGIWEQFKDDFYFICGEPIAPSYFIKPNEIAIAVIPLCEENMNKRIRIKRLGIYSNEFVQNISME